MPGRLVDTRPLRASPTFRRLWLGNTLSAVGGQLAVIAVLYQVWELTGSPAWVGAVGAVKAAPIVVLVLAGGSLADVVDRRRLVLLATVGQAMAAGLLAAQAFADVRSLWLVLALVAVHEAFGALGAPARKTFAIRLLARDQVAAGIALTHLGLQAAILSGPALAGAVTAQWGVAVCYLLDALGFGAALYGVLGLPAMPPIRRVAEPGVGTILDGWRFVAGRPVLRGALQTDLMATALAMPVALFPAVNEERFGGNPQTLGLFLSAIAVGGITAGAASGLVTQARRPGVVLLIGAGGWAVALTGFGLAGSLWLTLGWLAVAGAADTVSVISRGSIVQKATPDSYRGRVSAAEHAIGVAGPDLGNVRAGLVASATSATFAAVAGGVVCSLGIAAVAIANPALRRLTESRLATAPAH